MAKRTVTETVRAELVTTMREQSVGTQLRPSMGDGANLYEVGWTDEARAAAQLARRKGYRQTDRAGGTRLFEHPREGHVLYVNGNGSWRHRTSPHAGGAVEPNTVKTGRDSGELRLHLGQVHGTMSDDRESVSVSAQAPVVRAEVAASPWGMGPGGSGYEDMEEVGWTDEARAAARVARAAGFNKNQPYKPNELEHPSTGNKIKINPEDGSWTYHHRVGAGHTRTAQGRNSDDLDEHLGRLRLQGREAGPPPIAFSRGGGASKNTAPVLGGMSIGEAEDEAKDAKGHGSEKRGGKYGVIARLKDMGYKTDSSERQPGAHVFWMRHSGQPSVDDLRRSSGATHSYDSVDQTHHQVGRDATITHSQGRPGSVVVRLHSKGPSGLRDRMGIDQDLEAEARETGWTDEARQAAAAARARGFVPSKRSRSAGSWHVDLNHGESPWHNPTTGQTGHLSTNTNTFFVHGEHGNPSWGDEKLGPGKHDPQYEEGLKPFNQARVVRASLDGEPGEKTRSGAVSGPRRPEHDDTDEVPVQSFLDDVRHKVRKRSVMPGGALDQDAHPRGPSLDPGKTNEQRPDDGPVDGRGVPVPGEPIYSKEAVNYRYAPDPKRSCGECRFFREPAACRLVMGLILETDTCDKFEDDDEVKAAEREEEGAMGRVVRAQLMTESATREVGWTDEARAAAQAARAATRARTTQHSWGKLTVANRGADYSAVMHPEHRQALAALKDGEQHRFKDEQGKTWDAERDGDHINLKNARGGQPMSFRRSEISDEPLWDERPHRPAMRETWSDAARQASAIARMKGYGGYGGDKDGPSGMTYMRRGRGRNDHFVTIRPDGSWDHQHANGKVTSGNGYSELRGHLNVVHPAPPTSMEDDMKRESCKPCRESGAKFPAYFARHKNGQHIGLERALEILKGMEAVGYESPLGEVSPPGWEGTVKHMKKHPEISNPWALSWYMKNRGYTPHKEQEPAPGKMTRLIQGKEVGWTDEARQAASLARQHGYAGPRRAPDGGQMFRHPKGHGLLVKPDGGWSHDRVGRRGDFQPRAHGSGSVALATRLFSTHGRPASEDEGAPSMDFQRPSDRGLAPTGRLDSTTNVSFRQESGEDEGAQVTFAGKRPVHFEPHKPHAGEMDHPLHQRESVVRGLVARIEDELLEVDAVQALTKKILSEGRGRR